MIRRRPDVERYVGLRAHRLRRSLTIRRWGTLGDGDSGRRSHMRFEPGESSSDAAARISESWPWPTSRASARRHAYGASNRSPTCIAAGVAAVRHADGGVSSSTRSGRSQGLAVTLRSTWTDLDEVRVRPAAARRTAADCGALMTSVMTIANSMTLLSTAQTRPERFCCSCSDETACRLHDDGTIATARWPHLPQQYRDADGVQSRPVADAQYRMSDMMNLLEGRHRHDDSDGSRSVARRSLSDTSRTDDVLVGRTNGY